MTSKYHIERLGHLGDGIAAGPVYAPGTLPGEVVAGTLNGDRLTDIKIITPTTDRVRPPCSHFKSCGGCSLQFASDDFIAGWKADVVRDALANQNLDAPIRQVLTSPPRSRRRATLSGRRTKKGAVVGLHARASDAIIEIPNCHLLRDDLTAAIPASKELTISGASRKGEIAIAVTVSQAGLDVAVRQGRPLDEGLRASLAELATKHDFARLSWDGELVAGLRPPLQLFGTTQVVPPPGAFLQATRHGQQALVRAVLQAVGPARHIVDLFAGCGTFSLPLAQKAPVHTVEGEPDMLAALDTGWRHSTGLRHITTEARDLFRRPLLARELASYDAVVIDPPRAGAEAQVNELAQGSARIAMVSCKPVTMARDAKILCQSGYRIDWIDVVDQFRWSPHVELVAAMSKN